MTTDNRDIEFQVYRTWPEEVVRQALADFKTEMYDGAGIAELQGGLRCLDFLTLKTPLPTNLEEDIEATCLQANIRIDLLIAQPQAVAAGNDALQRAERGVEGLRQMVNTYRHRFLEGRIGYHVDDVYAAVQQRVARRRLLSTA